MTAPDPVRAARRLASRNADRLQDMPREAHLAQVVAVGSGGNVTVTWRGADVVTAGKNAAYSPSVGDLVMCLFSQSRLFVICPINGQP